MRQQSQKWALAASLLIALLGAIGVLGAYNIWRVDEHRRWVAHTQEVIAGLEHVLSLARDAESGQRGYLITGEGRYLEPYNTALTALSSELDHLEALTADNAHQRSRFPELRQRLTDRLNTLHANMELRRDRGLDSARDAVLTDRGRTEMEALQTVATEMIAHERELFGDRTRSAEAAAQLATRAAAAREIAKNAMRDADRRKDEFLATLAHELRNPLAPIRNAVQFLLVKGSPDPESHWSAEVIERQVRHMARLLDDLLDVSRITHNKLELRRERVELAPILRSAVETSRPLLEHGSHELSVELPPEPIYVDADPVRLAQVFANLLNNAAKYTEPGGHVQLVAARRGDSAVVSVRDDGIGIDAELLPRLFEIFAQSKRVIERSQGGLGVGLSLVRGLVELHGGRIEAHSDGPGTGSEFIVHLPIATSDATAAGTGDPRRVDRRPRAVYRLLIVDDVKDGAESLAILLRSMGHDVRTSFDGESAISVAETFEPDVVLLDIGMPAMSGYDVCRHIRSRPWGKRIRIVALTGWSQDDDRRSASEAGFDHHMVKPLDAEDLAVFLDGLSARPAVSPP